MTKLACNILQSRKTKETKKDSWQKKRDREWGSVGTERPNMHTLKIRMLCILCGIAGCFQMVQAGEPFRFKFRSRALLDAAVSGYGKEQVQGYYRLEDFRLGFKATYNNYEMKADIGLGSNNKVSIKDLLLNYHFKKGILSVGNTYDPYSMDMLISTADLRFHQSAGSALAFTDGRKVGVTYHLTMPACYWGTGLYTHNDINKLGDKQVNALVTTTRLVWRKRWKQHLLHVGGAFSFRSQPVNTPEPPRKSVTNVGVTSMFASPLMQADVDHLGTELKGVFEMLYTSPRFMVQGEYFLNRLNRTSGGTYRPQGGYVQAGFLAKGSGFDYDNAYALAGRPSSKQAIEIVARYNFTNLNDRRASVFGGSESDWSLGVNFYLNEYLAFKVNGSYVHVGKHCHDFYAKHLLLGQMRVQYIF